MPRAKRPSTLAPPAGERVGANPVLLGQAIARAVYGGLA